MSRIALKNDDQFGVMLPIKMLDILNINWKALSLAGTSGLKFKKEVHTT